MRAPHPALYLPILLAGCADMHSTTVDRGKVTVRGTASGEFSDWDGRSPCTCEVEQRAGEAIEVQIGCRRSGSTLLEFESVYFTLDRFDVRRSGVAQVQLMDEAWELSAFITGIAEMEVGPAVDLPDALSSLAHPVFVHHLVVPAQEAPSADGISGHSYGFQGGEVHGLGVWCSQSALSGL